MAALTAVIPDEQIEEIDSKIRELSEMLPFSSPDTRKSFLKKIDRLLDERLVWMRGGRC